jgi:hypothetical protein
LIKHILKNQFIRYPALQIQDLYKLLHQAALGSEHAVPDEESAWNRLNRELAEMGDGPLEPLVDPISADGGIVRIHMRPYLAAGHDPELLLAAFIRTAKEYHGEYHLLEQFWQEAVHMAYFSAVLMDEFIHSMKTQNHPAIHHSSEYHRIYRPSYRVVASAFCPKSWIDNVGNGS